MRLRLTLEYAGTRYSGWQIQRNARTVQGELDRAVREATGQTRFELYGAGRTDAGVHALAQVAHLDGTVPMPPETLLRRVNDELPADINVLSVEPVDRRFHARHSAVERSYLYQIARRRTAFGKALVWWIRDPLDVEAIRAGAGRLGGLRDFRSFTEADPSEVSTRVLLTRIEVAEAGDLVLIRFRGSHFLWKMVRRLVGVLAAIGRDELRLGDLDGFLRTASAQPARFTAPPSGLFLERVFYPGDPLELPLDPVLSLPSWPGPG